MCKWELFFCMAAKSVIKEGHLSFYFKGLFLKKSLEDLLNKSWDIKKMLPNMQALGNREHTLT